MTIPRELILARLLALAIVGGLVTGLTATLAFGAPAALDCRYVSISVPTPGATLSGATEIRGRALVLNFQFFKVEYAPLGQEGWVLIGTDVVRTPVDNGPLVLWQTSRVPDGMYQLRLRVVDPTGNYCDSLVSPVRVLNAHATEAPLPVEPTETLELTVVPPQATPTIPVVIPKEVMPSSGTPSALPTRGQPLPFGMPDLMVTGAFFLFGVCGMLGIVAAIAVYIYVRKLLS
jgi:hypothetical protein